MALEEGKMTESRMIENIKESRRNRCLSKEAIKSSGNIFTKVFVSRYLLRTIPVPCSKSSFL
jgi:hypothetical protein